MEQERAISYPAQRRPKLRDMDKTPNFDLVLEAEGAIESLSLCIQKSAKWASVVEQLDSSLRKLAEKLVKVRQQLPAVRCRKVIAFCCILKRGRSFLMQCSAQKLQTQS